MQLELMFGVVKLREALNHLINNALECTEWTYRMHEDHRRYLLAFLKDVPLTDVTYARICEYKKAEQKRGLAMETIRKRLSTLHMALEEAVRMGWVAKVPPWPVLKSDSKPKKDYWTSTEWEAANLGCEDEDLATFIAIGFWCGSHTSDIYRFRWCDVDFARDTWVRRNKKSKAEPTELPLPPRLRQLLQERYDRLQPHRRDLVCGRNMGHPNRQLRALALRCGIPSIRPIGLRHSCVTYLKKQGWDDDYRAFWIGHKSVAVTKKTYTHFTCDDVRKEMSKANAAP